MKLSQDEFRKIAKVVYDLAGIHLAEEKLGLLSNRLRKRLGALHLESFADYHKLISSKAGLEEELPHFLSAVTTNETYFFRNEQLWKYFGTEFVPDLVSRKGDRGKSVRIWSAASSSGEEAYTAAISLREHLPNVDSWVISIIGSDISAKVLEKAKIGIYNDYAVGKMPAAQVNRWFTKLPTGEFQLTDTVRKMVKFQFHNLKELFPNGRFDLVFLRNVLMYFDVAMKKRVLEVVTEALIPGGILIVGDVDPIRTVPELSSCMKLNYVRPGTYQKPAGVDAKKALVTT